MTYMATPRHKNLCPGGHGIYNFGKPFIGLHNYKVSLFEQCHRVEKKIF